MDGTTRKIKMGLNATVLTVAFGGILVLAYIISLRYPQQYDVTKTKTNTMARETRDLMKTLSKKKIPVTATAFFPARSSEERRIKDLLAQLNRQSDFFQYEIVDPLTRPGVFRQMGMSDYGVIVAAGSPGSPEFRRKILAKSDLFRYDPATGEESFTGEQGILNAVIAVALKKDSMVCFIEGQGEFSITSTKPDGLSKLADALEAEAYAINVARISNGKPIPQDCKVAIMAGPQAAITSGARDTLNAFVARGGGLLLLLHSGGVPGTADLLSQWGLSLSEKVVIDKSRSADPDGFLVRPAVLPHPVTEKISPDDNSLKLLYPAPVTIAGKPPKGIKAAPLLATSDQASECAVVDYGAYQQLECGKNKSRRTLAAAVDAPGKSGRILVVGNSLFATNDFLRTAVVIEDNVETARVNASEDNAAFVLNSVNWLAGEENIIALRPKPAQNTELSDAYDYTKRMTVFKLFTFVIPLGILVVGGLVWRWRQSL